MHLHVSLLWALFADIYVQYDLYVQMRVCQFSFGCPLNQRGEPSCHVGGSDSEFGFGSAVRGGGHRGGGLALWHNLLTEPITADHTLGPPVVPFLSPCFWLGGFPSGIRLQKKVGTFLLTSLQEDLLIAASRFLSPTFGLWTKSCSRDEGPNGRNHLPTGSRVLSIHSITVEHVVLVLPGDFRKRKFIQWLARAPNTRGLGAPGCCCFFLFRVLLWTSGAVRRSQVRGEELLLVGGQGEL